MLVSIGVPTYNGARFLPMALDSLLAQDHSDIEIVISDNGSTDDTPDICQGYATTDARIRYVRHAQNRGGAWNFRHVLDLCRGDYFAWHADDDLRSPCFVSATLQRLVSTGSVLCTTRTRAIGEDGKPHPRRIGPPLQGDTLLELVQRLCRPTYWADIYGLIRRQALEDVNITGRWGGDVIVTLELALKGRIVHEPSAETMIRVYDSRTVQDVAQRFDMRARWSEMLTELLKTIYRSPLPLSRKIRLSASLLGGMSENETMLRGLEAEKGLPLILMSAIRKARKLGRGTQEPAV
jgi:glycosyltransferase involved in cell wall biosynthesis